MNEPLVLYRFSPGQMHKDTERILFNMLRVQEKVFKTSPALYKLDISTLDRCFYDYYLRLTRFYIKNNQSDKARPLLRRYIQMRGLTHGCLKTMNRFSTFRGTGSWMKRAWSIPLYRIPGVLFRRLRRLVWRK